MKFDRDAPELDPIDLAILDQLQENCKLPLAVIGDRVGLGASSVTERIHKLEHAGVIRGYAAILDARVLGRDVTAFIGLSAASPRAVSALGTEIEALPEVLECHHITGEYTLLLKVKTRSTATLEHLIDAIREMDGVTGTETMVVLSTQTERVRLPLEAPATPESPRPRRSVGARMRANAS